MVTPNSFPSKQCLKVFFSSYYYQHSIQYIQIKNAFGQIMKFPQSNRKPDKKNKNIANDFQRDWQVIPFDNKIAWKFHSQSFGERKMYCVIFNPITCIPFDLSPINLPSSDFIWFKVNSTNEIVDDSFKSSEKKEETKAKHT